MFEIKLCEEENIILVNGRQSQQHFLRIILQPSRYRKDLLIYPGMSLVQSGALCKTCQGA